MLQLCHALMEAGCRDPCLALLPQALLPAGGTILSLQLQSNLVTDIEELLPLVAKHGGWGVYREGGRPVAAVCLPGTLKVWGWDVPFCGFVWGGGVQPPAHCHGATCCSIAAMC
jgi:hypothetical protein